MVLVTVRPRVMSHLLLYRSKPGCPARRTRLPARKHQCGPPRSNLAAMQSVLWEKRFACAIRITGDSCCDRRASCAAACRRIRIISPLHNRVHSGAVRATSSSSRSAESIIESYIALVTRPHGGGSSTSTRFLSRLGSGSRRGRMAIKVTRSFGKTPAWMRDELTPSRHREVPPVTELQKRRPKDGRYAQRDGAL